MAMAWVAVQTGMGTQLRAACLSRASRFLLCMSDGSDLGLPLLSLVPPRPGTIPRS